MGGHCTGTGAAGTGMGGHCNGAGGGCKETGRGCVGSTGGRSNTGWASPAAGHACCITSGCELSAA